MSRSLEAVEIVAIGEELLSGATIDTNAARIAEEVETIGLRVVRKTTVGDVPEAIADAVRSALERTGAVITIGGLGPTKDDATKASVARVLGRELEFRPELWESLQRRYAPRGQLPASNRSQAEVPRGAEVFANPRGTAPGLAIDDEQGVCILLPGPPGELEAILTGSVLGYLGQRVGEGARRPFRRQLRTAGIAESALAEGVGDRLDDLPLDVAYLPEVDGVDVRLTCWATEESAVREPLEEGMQRLRDALGLHVYAEGRTDLVEVIGDLLRSRGWTVAVAESCTGGLLGQRLTAPSGASDYFWGGAIAYDNAAKRDMLGVSAEALERHGAVSEAVAREMAAGACQRSGADCSIAITGIAGPTGGTEDKPVGTVFIGVQVAGSALAKHRHYAGTRDMVRARAAQGGMDLLRRTILQSEG